jgi:hypothetical protein
VKRIGALLVCSALAGLAVPALAESAFNQAVTANKGSFPTPPPVSGPVCVANCGTRTVTHTPTRSPSYGYKPSMAIGAAVFGSLLEDLLFSPSDSAPDPAVLRQQEEARRQAAEEAARRAEEERIRHEHLLSLLTTLPLSRAFSATPGTQGTTDLGLTALRSLDSPGDVGVAVTERLDGNAEQLRSLASQGWDTADTRFAVRWQPLPLTKSVSLPLARPLCQNKHCAWPTDAGAKVPRLAKPKGTTHVLDQNALVQILNQPGKNYLSPDAALIAGLMARTPDQSGIFGRYVISERLQRFSGKAAKELIWVVVARLLEEKGGTLGKGITLMRDVYDLASTDMQDAIKVAGWLGSTSTDAPPEITSPEEAAIPFLNRALGASEVFGEKAAYYASAGVDATQLANKMLSLWRDAQ